jgi:hypothetical protein
MESDKCRRVTILGLGRFGDSPDFHRLTPRGPGEPFTP